LRRLAWVQRLPDHVAKALLTRLERVLDKAKRKAARAAGRPVC
jgi:hypothetical protein